MVSDKILIRPASDFFILLVYLLHLVIFLVFTIVDRKYDPNWDDPVRIIENSSGYSEYAIHTALKHIKWFCILDDGSFYLIRVCVDEPSWEANKVEIWGDQLFHVLLPLCISLFVVLWNLVLFFLIIFVEADWLSLHIPPFHHLD